MISDYHEYGEFHEAHTFQEEFVEDWPSKSNVIISGPKEEE